MLRDDAEHATRHLQRDAAAGGVADDTFIARVTAHFKAQFAVRGHCADLYSLLTGDSIGADRTADHKPTDEEELARIQGIVVDEAMMAEDLIILKMGEILQEVPLSQDKNTGIIISGNSLAIQVWNYYTQPY